MELRERQIRTIIVNGRILNKVLIDTHVFEHGHTDEKWYRLVWLLQDDQNYVGVRTAFRETRRGR